MFASVCARPIVTTDFSEVADGYSELSGVLAGFAFVGVTSILVAHTRSERKDAALLYALAPMTAVFIGLVFVSLNYGVLVGEDGKTPRIGASSVFSALGFASAGILLPYVVQILIHAAGAGETAERKQLITQATVVLKLVTVLSAPLFALLLAVAVQDYIDFDSQYEQIHCVDFPPIEFALWVAAALLLNGIAAWASLGAMRYWPKSAPARVAQWFRDRGPTIAVVLAVSTICIGVVCIVMIRWILFQPVDAEHSVPLLVWSSQSYSLLAAVTTWAALTYDVDAAEQRKKTADQASAEPATPVTSSTDAGPSAGDPESAGTPELRLKRPLGTNELDERTVDVFPQAYLTNISIIQGVALGFLATKIMEAIQASQVSLWILVPHAQ